MKRLAFAVLLLTAACGTDSPDAGPDASLAANGADAGAPDATPPDAGDADATPARSCALADPCTGESVCIANQCEPAWGRDYRVWIYRAEVPALDPDGAEWDIGSAPDLYVLVYVGEAPGYTTQIVRNDFSAEFTGESFVVRNVPRGATITFYVADDDSNPAHPDRSRDAFGCERTVTADLVDPSRGDGAITCPAALGLGTAVAKIEPL